MNVINVSMTAFILTFNECMDFCVHYTLVSMVHGVVYGIGCPCRGLYTLGMT